MSGFLFPVFDLSEAHHRFSGAYRRSFSKAREHFEDKKREILSRLSSFLSLWPASSQTFASKDKTTH